MPNHEFYFVENQSGPAFNDFAQMNHELELQNAPYRYGPSLENLLPIWAGGAFPLIGLYKTKEDLPKPEAATITLEEAFQKEGEARWAYPAYAPSKPELPEQYDLLRR